MQKSRASNRRVIVWVLVVPFGPAIVIWSFGSTLAKGIASAFIDAWNDAAIEINAIRRSLSRDISHGADE